MSEHVRYGYEHFSTDLDRWIPWDPGSIHWSTLERARHMASRSRNRTRVVRISYVVELVEPIGEAAHWEGKQVFDDPNYHGARGTPIGE